MVPQLRKKYGACFDHFSSEVRLQTPYVKTEVKKKGNENPNLMVPLMTSNGLILSHSPHLPVVSAYPVFDDLEGCEPWQ